MSTKPNGRSRQGFASKPKRERVKIAQRAGSIKNPNKGFGSVPREVLSQQSKEAAQKRWDKVRAEREAVVAPDTEAAAE